jgi:hypothetical protein
VDQPSYAAAAYLGDVKRLILLLAVLTWPAAAQYSPAAQEVLALAPELEACCGSKANFESLAGGLGAAKPVRLVTITPEGMREIVSFSAAKAMSPEDTARVLENARYHLLERGLTAPSGWDIARVLMGHMDITPAGPVRQPGLLAPADPRKPMTLSLRPFAGSPGNYRSLMRGITQGSVVSLADPVDSRLTAQGIGEPVIDEVRSSVLGVLEARCSAAGS